MSSSCSLVIVHHTEAVRVLPCVAGPAIQLQRLRTTRTSTRTSPTTRSSTCRRPPGSRPWSWCAPGRRCAAQWASAPGAPSWGRQSSSSSSQGAGGRRRGLLSPPMLLKHCRTRCGLWALQPHHLGCSALCYSTCSVCLGAPVLGCSDSCPGVLHPVASAPSKLDLLLRHVIPAYALTEGVEW